MMGMEEETTSNAVFGATSDRVVYPNPLKGSPYLGPATYNTEQLTNMQYILDHKMLSSKGYTLAARTAQKFPKDSHERTRFVYDLTNFRAPDPSTYQRNWSAPRRFEPAQKPFNLAMDRFPIYKRDLDEVPPGPGTYEYNVEPTRKVMWHQSFGGSPINLPSVSQRSTIMSNTDKLMSTKDEQRYHRRLAYLKLYYP